MWLKDDSDCAPIEMPRATFIDDSEPSTSDGWTPSMWAWPLEARGRCRVRFALMPCRSSRRGRLSWMRLSASACVCITLL